MKPETFALLVTLFICQPCAFVIIVTASMLSSRLSRIEEGYAADIEKGLK